MWAFGVVLYEMLAGHVPFRGSTPFAIGEAIGANHCRRSRQAFRPGCAPSWIVAGRGGPPIASARGRGASGVRTLQSGREPETPHVASGAPRRRLFPVKPAWRWAAGAVAAALVASVAVWLFSARPQVRLVSTGGPASSNQQANEAFELAISFRPCRTIWSEAASHSNGRFNSIPSSPSSPFSRTHERLSDPQRLFERHEPALSSRRPAPRRDGHRSHPDRPVATGRRRRYHPGPARGRTLGALERELQSDPRHATNRMWKGIGLWLAGDIAGAKREFRTTLDFLPLFGAARMLTPKRSETRATSGGRSRNRAPSSNRPQTTSVRSPG